MSTLFNGNGTIPFSTSATKREVGVNSATDASPISIYAPGHGFNTGDTVEIQGVTGNTAANGVWQITVVDSNDFLLNNSTGNGASTGGGYAIDYEVQPAFAMPAPGDAASVVTLGPMLEGLSNAIPFLNRRCGKLRLVNQYFGLFNTADLTYAAWSTLTSINTSQFSLMPNSTKTAQAISDFTGVSPNFDATNDWIDIHACFSAYAVSTSGSIYLNMGVSLVQSGSSVAFGGGGLVTSSTSPTNGNVIQVSSRIVVKPGIIAANTPVSFAIGMQSGSTGATSTTAYLLGPYTITAYQYRGN